MSLPILLLLAVTRAGDPVAGETKVAPCAGCHGAAGISANDVHPRLAGQSYLYIKKQLQDFASGRRANDPVMASFARPLSPADMADLAAYYSCLSPRDGAKPMKGLGSC